MNKIYVKDIVGLCKGKVLIGEENEVLENFVKDTREVKEGDIYIGIKGENYDGNLMYEDALKNGAKVCILQTSSVEKILDINNLKEKYNDRTIVTVDDTVKTLQELARYKRSLYDIPVIGITGSVGKTSTKDIIASVMSKKYNVLKTLGNYNNQIGLPLTILRLKDHEAMVVEMGMNELGEISNLTKIAKPTVAVITNVGTAHIGILGSRENILKAKLEILEGLKENGTLVINNDNDMLHDWYSKNKSDKYNVLTFGIENESDIMAKNVTVSENGSTYKVDINGEGYDVNVSVGGNHFVLNSLCAISIGKLFDIDMEDVLDGISNFELSKRRMQIEKNKIGATIINDCYNANYDSMKAALEYLGKVNKKRKIAVLGDMLELGEYSKTLHEQVGDEVANNNIDILVTVGELSEYIAKEAEQKGMNKEKIYTYTNNSDAIKLLNSIIDKEDAVLIKASNGMKFQDIYEKII